MDSDERRNKIIVGAVIIVVTVAIIALIVLKTSSSAALTCQLTDVDPLKAKHDDYKNVVSTDSKTLAFFDGYLRYELADKKDKKVYLPLQLSSVSIVPGSAENLQTLVLNLNCAQVNVTLKSDDKSVSATEAKVHLTTANGKVEECTVVSGLNLVNFAPNNHFACASFKLSCDASNPSPQPTPTTQPPTTPPTPTEKPTAKPTNAQLEPLVKFGDAVKVVTLKITKIAFELDGDVEKHKKLDFSKPEQGCAAH